MAEVKYIKMWKDGSFELIEEDRVERFLEEGWTLSNDGATQEKKSPAKGSKNKITADAQVTSIKKDEEEEWDVFEDELISDDESNNAKEEN